MFQFLEIIELPCLELNSKIIYNDTKGNKTEKIFSDCLFHIVNHHTHHLGQVSTSLKLHKINISTDYTYYI